MKAAFFVSPNHLKVKETKMPQLEEGEALVKVCYAGICGSDVHVFQGKHPTAAYPVIPGHEFSGILADAKGTLRGELKTGDAVVVQPIKTCGLCEACITGHDNVCDDLHILGIHQDGGFAEYVKVPIQKVYALPKQVSLKMGALTEPLAVAVHDVRRSGIQAGQKALIIGGGPIGILIGLVAQYSGAEVYISEINPFRLNFITSLGLSAIDGANKDILEETARITDGKGFDVVYEVSGSKTGQRIMTSVGKIRATLMSIGMGQAESSIKMGEVIAKEQEIFGVRIHSQVNFEGALALLKKGCLNDKLDKLITKEFSLDEFPAAMKYQIEDPAHFKVVLDIGKE